MTQEDARKIDALVAEHVFAWKWRRWKPGQLEASIARFEEKQGVRFLQNPDDICADSTEPAHGDEPTRETLRRKYNTWESGLPNRSTVAVDSLFPPSYSTDPAADYSVLVRVRETWASEALCCFRDELRKIFELRDDPEWKIGGFVVLHGGRYEPGDYSRAALAALGVTP